MDAFTSLDKELTRTSVIHAQVFNEKEYFKYEKTITTVRNTPTSNEAETHETFEQETGGYMTSRND